MLKGEGERTLDLLIALSVEAADLDVLLLEYLETPCEWVSNLQVSVGVAARLAVVERRFHLADGRDHLLRLFNHPLLLGRHEADLVLQGIGQRGKELSRTPSALGRHRHTPCDKVCFLPPPRGRRDHGLALRSRQTSRAAGQ